MVLAIVVITWFTQSHSHHHGLLSLRAVSGKSNGRGFEVSCRCPQVFVPSYWLQHHGMWRKVLLWEGNFEWELETLGAVVLYLIIMITLIAVGGWHFVRRRFWVRTRAVGWCLCPVGRASNQLLEARLSREVLKIKDYNTQPRYHPQRQHYQPIAWVARIIIMVSRLAIRVWYPNPFHPCLSRFKVKLRPARYSQVISQVQHSKPVSARFSQVQPGSARFSQVKLGSAR